MAQPKLTRSGTTNLLPYPTTFTETVAPRSVDHAALDGTISRDFDQSGVISIRTYEIEWEELSSAEMNQVITAYRGLADMSVWTFTTPRGSTASVALDPEQPQLSITLVPGVGGTVLYTVNLVLWTGGA